MKVQNHMVDLLLWEDIVNWLDFLILHLETSANGGRAGAPSSSSSLDKSF